MAGGASKCVHNWRSMIGDKWVCDMVEGITLELTGLPGQTVWPDSTSMSTAKNDALRGQVQNMLHQGSIEVAYTSNRAFVSHLFLREKSNGDSGHRPILNLTRLNEYIVYRHFKMDHIPVVMQLITPGNWLASIDISQAYHSLYIRPCDRDLLQFTFEGKRYRYTCLPNGVSSGPRIFTRVMKAVMSYLRQEFNLLLCFYIDDTILIGDSPAEVTRAVNLTMQTLTSLGFTINVQKSALVPTQKLEFLGFEIDSSNLSVSIPKPKVEEISGLAKYLVNKRVVTVRAFSKLIGKFAATANGNDWAHVYIKSLQVKKARALAQKSGDYDAKLHLSQPIRLSIEHWITHLSSASRSYLPRIAEKELYTDASTHGWGYHDKTAGARYGEEWDECTAKLHINVLELKAVLLSLTHLERAVYGKHILLFVDNTTAMRCIIKGGSTKSELCNEVTQQIHQVCTQGGITLAVNYCPSAENAEADNASRVFTSSGEWSLSTETLEFIGKYFRMPEIDYFASDLNKVCNKYVTRYLDPNAYATDALTLSWQDTDGFFFPPFSLASRVLQKVLMEWPRGVLVLPHWPTQPWFPMLHKLLRTRRSVSLPVTQSTLHWPTDNTATFPLAGPRHGKHCRLRGQKRPRNSTLVCY